MKRNLLGLFAVVLAVAVSSFTVKKTTTFYFVYGSGDQSVRSNYTQTTTEQDPLTGQSVLAWFSVVDANDVITDTEFTNAFETIDVTSTSSNSLNDEAEGSYASGSIYLEKKN